jgi:pyruvate kinase
MTMVKAKIICTLGPASASEGMIRKMVMAGMDVVRLNCSHSKPPRLASYIKAARAVNKKYRRHIRILLDLEGPRIRIGKLKGHKPVTLKKRQAVWLVKKDIHEGGNLIPFDYEGPVRSIRGAEYIYIDDGNIVLKIKDVKNDSVKTEVVVGGLLKEHKGVNIPGAKLEFAGLSEKDKNDIAFGLEQRVDYIAQSFVKDSSDIMEIRDTLKNSRIKPKIIAKIENREGIKNIDRIIDVSDGVMVARGDMGVSVPIYEIPIIQKYIIKKCNKKKKLVITATQMLESMVENVRPTRAEVTDVANAVIDGSDFVMLSAETAIGKYPAETVKMMNNIIKFTENNCTLF